MSLTEVKREPEALIQVLVKQNNSHQNEIETTEALSATDDVNSVTNDDEDNTRDMGFNDFLPDSLQKHDAADEKKVSLE